MAVGVGGGEVGCGGELDVGAEGGVGGEGGEVVFEGGGGERVGTIGGDVAEGAEDEGALEHERVRDGETGGRNVSVGVKEDVEVYRPRTLVYRLYSAQIILNCLESIQQLLWFKRRFHLQNH